MVLNITEKPEVAEKFIYFVFFKTKEKRFLVCHFKNTLETLFCTTEESEFVREEIQVTLKNYCWLFLWILAEESHNRRGDNIQQELTMFTSTLYHSISMLKVCPNKIIDFYGFSVH